jgi:hypothetical protein
MAAPAAETARSTSVGEILMYFRVSSWVSDGHRSEPQSLPVGLDSGTHFPSLGCSCLSHRPDHVGPALLRRWVRIRVSGLSEVWDRIETNLRWRVEQELRRHVSGEHMDPRRGWQSEPQSLHLRLDSGGHNFRA